ncbi:MAG: hypothetical protein M3015_03315 [Bacteroidota bacterium]|nr:hypothetical protein [Bacteroidota bacterium]
MQKIIASYLVQKKECNLPGIGNFKINMVPASLDVANKKMFPPAAEIIFTEGDVHLQRDLVNYVSNQQKVGEQQAADNITRWCHNVSESLDAGEKIIFESIGSLQKNAAGNIFLHAKKEFRLYDAVIAERVIHKNEDHAVLVGDKETTSAVMNEYYKADTVFERKFSWKIWAIVLFSLSLLSLILHFSYHSFNTAGVGNQISVSPLPPPVSYTPIK